MTIKQWHQTTALTKELAAVAKQEDKLLRAAQKAKPLQWKKDLESKLPAHVASGLESAFCKGFSGVFRQGKTVIEKGYDKESLKADYDIRNFAVQRKGGRKELRQMHKSAKKSDFLNLAVTTAEGIGLGALGIGMPDIVLFLGTLLKGIYETALHYGYDYDTRQEQLLILKMMETALCHGEDWVRRNEEVDQMLILETVDITQEDFRQQLEKTASVFAMDMLLLKFVQGLPLIGILGGAANPVYYRKVLQYVQLKYRKRYLLQQKEKLP